MKFLTELFGNRIFISAALGWFVAQVLKTLIHMFITKQFVMERMVGSGGMPSSHSATVCGLATAVGIRYGGGSYEFAMAKAPVEREFSVKGFEDVKAGIVKWPMSVIRIASEDTQRLIVLADKILAAWRGYTDEDAFILAETEGEPHNTITPIARKRGDLYELDLVLRNNITTEEHPMGVYHPHAELHHIKKENIGLIEVMGLAVLPARLKDEMETLADAIVNKKDIRSDETIAKHADWTEEFLPKYQEVTKENVVEILHKEIALVFSKVLEQAGVYKRDEAGQKAFDKFVASLDK